MSEATSSSFTPKWYDSSFMVVVALLLFFPVGLYALFKNRRLGAGGKLLLGGAVMFFMLVTAGLMGFGGYWLLKEAPAFKQSMQQLTGGDVPKPGNRATQQDSSVTGSKPSTRFVSLKSGDDSHDIASVVQIPGRSPGRPEETVPPAPPAPIDPVRAQAEADARALEKGAAETQADIKLFALLQQKQADEYEHVLIEFASAATAEKKAAASQKFAALNDSDARVRDYHDRIAQQIDDLNGRLTASGKARFSPLEVDAGAQRRINGARASFAALSSNPQPLAVGPVQPRIAVPPPTVQVPPPAIVYPPVVQTPPPPPPPRVIAVAPAVSSADMIGGWRRADNMVSWVFNPDSSMSSHMGGKSNGGTWTLDEKTSQLSVVLNGFTYFFVVTRANNQLFMSGSVVGGSSKLNFSKAVK